MTTCGAKAGDSSSVVAVNSVFLWKARGEMVHTGTVHWVWILVQINSDFW